jgi:hypothetical protein
VANQKISARTLLTGAGALSTPVARSGSTANYRVVNNLIATADPTVTDDIDLGYHVGSLWRRSDTREEWYCTDATDGAAVWVPRWGQFQSHRNRFYAYTDGVISGGAGIFSDHFTAAWSGAGASVTDVTLGSLNGIGINTLNLGTSTSGKASISSGALNCMKLGSGIARYSAKVNIPVLSNGTDTFITQIGFMDNVTGTPSDSVSFRYTHSVNAGEWEAVTRSNGVETATDTNVAVVAGTFKTFRIEVNAAGTSVGFYIDDVLVATNTTNIPTGAGRELGYGIRGEKTAGTTATSGAQIDWQEVEILFTTKR